MEAGRVGLGVVISEVAQSGITIPTPVKEARALIELNPMRIRCGVK